METMVRSASEVFLSDVLAQLNGLDPHGTDRVLLSDEERVRLAELALSIAGRLQGFAGVLVAEADRVSAPQAVVGVGTLSWLHDAHRLTRREAGTLLKDAQELAGSPALRNAVLTGDATPLQARAVTRVLAKLPDDLPVPSVRQAEELMVGFCAQFDSHELSRLSRHLLEVIAPETAEESTQRRLERELRVARAARFLSFRSDGFGSVLIRGSLPTADAELLRAQIEAIAHLHHRQALDRADPFAERCTPTQRRADALIELARAAALHQDPPAHGGDRPRIMVLIDHDRLLQDCRDAHLLNSGDTLTPAQLRQLACDAGILPVVLNGRGEVLDVGRAHRLVTPAIRTALNARDRGCVFPGCDRTPASCDAHHITPWQQGGATALNNLVLLCRHHHNTVEPDHRPPDTRWQVRLDAGVPVVIPPRRVDPQQRPRRHHRHHRKAPPDPEPGRVEAERHLTKWRSR